MLSAFDQNGPSPEFKIKSNQCLVENRKKKSICASYIATSSLISTMQSIGDEKTQRSWCLLLE
jgi:hypothetical protein